MDEDHGRIALASSWLAFHAGGVVDRQMTEHLTELLRAVLETGRRGSVTLKLTVERTGDDNSVTVQPELVLKAPQAGGPRHHFYVDPTTGMLATSDPFRPQLPFATHDLTGDRSHDLT